MRSTRTMMAAAGVAVALVLLVAGCSDSDSSDDEGSGTVGDNGGDGDSIQSGDPLTASVVLENGSQAAFPIECHLEPHEQDGEQVLFSATSTTDGPGSLDVIQYAPESRDGAAVIRASDPDTDELIWSAEGTDPIEADLNLDGSTIDGSGTFYEGDDRSGAGVVGQLTANC